MVNRQLTVKKSYCRGRTCSYSRWARFTLQREYFEGLASFISGPFVHEEMRFFLPLSGCRLVYQSNKQENGVDIGNVLCEVRIGKSSIWAEDKKNIFYKHSLFHL